MLEKSIYLLLTIPVFYYFATALQWYSYKLKRVIFHFSKPIWHIWFFALPLSMIGIAGIFEKPIWAGLYLFIFMFYFASWVKKLDKKLVFTARVKRLGGIFAALMAPPFLLLHADYQLASAIIAIFGAYYISAAIETKIIAKGFEEVKGETKINNFPP